MTPVIVLTAGRSGSTMLSQALSYHPDLCSISEYWSALGYRVFGDPVVSRQTFMRYLRDPTPYLSVVLEAARRAGDFPGEITYDFDRGRHTEGRLPPISMTVLPSLTDEPDTWFDDLGAMVPEGPARPVTGWSRAVFEALARRTGRPGWIERSGMSFLYLPEILTCRGFYLI